MLNFHNSHRKKLESDMEVLLATIAKAKWYVEKLTNDDFNFEIMDENDLYQGILHLKNKLEESQKAAFERNWTNEGLAKLNEVMKKNASEERFDDAWLAFLVNYLQCNQGAIFIEEEVDGQVQLKLMSSYAYGRKKWMNIAIYPGEGLVGQCYLEKEYIYLTNIPQNYTTITSGLGEATPHALLLVPIVFQERVWGIIELASFQGFETYQTQWVHKVADTFGVAIFNRSNQVKTSQMLAQSQLLTEQLRAQEEEMRQNMEELEATQEELVRKDALKEKELNLLKEEYNVKIEELRMKEAFLKHGQDLLLKKLLSNNTLIDMAGRQRMLSQKISFYAEMVARGKLEHKVQLKAAMELHDNSLRTIRLGGVAPGMESVEEIEPALPTNDTIAASVQHLWDLFKSQIEIILAWDGQKQEEIFDALGFVENNSEHLLKLNNELLLACTKQNQLAILNIFNESKND